MIDSNSDDPNNYFVVVATTTILMITISFHVTKWFMNRKRFIDAINKLPGPPVKGSNPFFCHFHKNIQSIGSIPKEPAAPRNIEINLKYMKEYGQPHGIFRIWLFHPHHVPFAQPFIWITDPIMAKQILTDKKKSKHLIKYEKAYTLAKPLIGDSLLSMPSDMEWKHHRRIAAKCFGQQFMNHAYKVTNDIIKHQLFPQLENHQCQNLEFYEWSCRLTSEILGEVAFGQSFGGLQQGSSSSSTTSTSKPSTSSLYEVYNGMISIINSRIRHKPFETMFQFSENKTFNEYSNRLDSVISKIVQDRIQQKKDKKLMEYNDLLSFLMTESDDDDSGFELSYKYLFGNVRMFLYVGHETTSSALACGLWQLAKHERVQERLYEEVKSFFASTNKEEQGYNAMMKLEYLDAVAREILRLHPSAPVVRTTTNEIELDASGTVGHDTSKTSSYKIPANSCIMIMPYFIHRNKNYYDNSNNTNDDKKDNDNKKNGEGNNDNGIDDPGVERFDPDRFLQKNEFANSKDTTWMPFSVGPRDCVGKHLANLELKATIAQMVYRYKLRPSKDAIEPIHFFYLTMRPHEVLLDLELRE